MNVMLPAEMEAMIQGKVESGLFRDASEVVLEALKMMENQDKLIRLQSSLAESRAQYDRGEYFELTDELWEQIERDAAEADRLGEPIREDVMP